MISGKNLRAMIGGGAILLAVPALLLLQSLYPGGGGFVPSPYLRHHDLHNQVGLAALAGHERAMLMMADICRHNGNPAAADGYLRYGAVNLAGYDILIAYARRCEELHPGCPRFAVMWYRRAKMLALVQHDPERAAAAARELARVMRP